MIYAYARVSSKDQNLERQFDAFKNCGLEFKRIFWDKESGVDLTAKTTKSL